MLLNEVNNPSAILSVPPPRRHRRRIYRHILRIDDDGYYSAQSSQGRVGLSKGEGQRDVNLVNQRATRGEDTLDIIMILVPLQWHTEHLKF